MECVAHRTSCPDIRICPTATVGKQAARQSQQIAASDSHSENNPIIPTSLIAFQNRIQTMPRNRFLTPAPRLWGVLRSKRLAILRQARRPPYCLATSPAPRCVSPVTEPPAGMGLAPRPIPRSPAPCSFLRLARRRAQGPGIGPRRPGQLRPGSPSGGTVASTAGTARAAIAPHPCRAGCPRIPAP